MADLQTMVDALTEQNVRAIALEDNIYISPPSTNVKVYLSLNEVSNSWEIQIVNPRVDDEGVFVDTMLNGPSEENPEIEAAPHVVAEFVERFMAHAL